MTHTFDELTLKNDFLFKKVLQNKHICKRLIEEILHIKFFSISFPEIEKTIDASKDSKGIRLDVVVEDDKHTTYDIEMQALNTCRAGESILPVRTRYYQAMLDTHMLQKGQDYNQLNPTFIIFICIFDLFDQERYIYTFHRLCLEDRNLELKDRTAILFLNAKGIRGDVTPHTKTFLNYVDKHIVSDDFTKELEEEVLRVKKNDKNRREYMLLEMKLNDVRYEAHEEGRQEGHKDATIQIAREMLKDNMALATISRLTGLSIAELQQLTINNTRSPQKHP